MAYRRHCEEHPNDDEGHFILGTLQMLLNHVEDARRTFDICMRINPTFKSLNFNLGVCHSMINEFIESEKYFRIELENTNYSHLNSALNLADLHIDKMTLFDVESMIQVEDIIQKSIINLSENEPLKRKLDIIKYINIRNKKWSTHHIFKSRKELLSWIPSGAVVAEVGVQEGFFSEEILQCQPSQLHLIDCWDYQSPEVYTDHHANTSQAYHDDLYQKVVAKFMPDIKNKRVIIHRDYSSNALQTFENETFDWVYIDANHAYEFVKEDLALAYQKTKPGGFICGHDYVSEDCIKGYGVERAVDEFINEKNIIPIGITNELYASFILKKSDHAAN